MVILFNCLVVELYSNNQLTFKFAFKSRVKVKQSLVGARRATMQTSGKGRNNMDLCLIETRKCSWKKSYKVQQLPAILLPGLNNQSPQSCTCVNRKS
jgi:hypothetical protein